MAEGAQRPAYVLLGGVCHTPAFLSGLIECLQRRGFEAEAVAYPTIGEDTAGKTQQDEVEAVKQAVSRFVDDRQQDVILVLHSYGGWPGSRAIKGLDKETREQQGKRHGIVEVVFVAAFLLPDQARTADYLIMPDWLTVENDERIPNEKCIPRLFSDLDLASAQHWMAQFGKQRNDFTVATWGNAPWELPLPKTYILLTEDKLMSVQFQLKMLQVVINGTWSVKSLRSGHEPFLDKPEKLVEVLLSPVVR